MSGNVLLIMWTTLSEPAVDTSEIRALYTSLPEAATELEQRRKDCDLCTLVENYHRSLNPPFMSVASVGVLNRSIITPNRELDRYFSLLAQSRLLPLLVEFHEDFFVTHNRDKYRLGQQVFTKSPEVRREMSAVNWKSLKGKAPPRMSDLRTRNGLKLTDYHHALLEFAYPGCEKHLVDFSAWFLEARRGEFYYLRYLALFICHGILFDNYIVEDKSEMRFALDKVLPSFKKATELFGVRPLIVPLLPSETEHSDYWRSLPNTLYPHARELLRGKS